ncbi:alginate export family protein [Lysobacter sp. A3-1-A15]|uniref:alginate export family protein n=1 Tax=Novilysobacter viscosus TaxID=3098602 RepID=UPI002ED90893
MNQKPAMLTLAIASLCAFPAFSGEAVPGQVFSWSADARLRHEQVDDVGFARRADATTLRLRAGVGIRASETLSGYVEAEGTAALDDDYNSTANGRTGFPVVADPRAVELNQAWLRWKTDTTGVTAGRQRLLLANQRWVGNVGWRQNEQTFDAVAVNWQPGTATAVTYAWLDRVHRVNTDQALAPLARERALDTHLLDGEFKTGSQRIGGYLYLHDDQDQPAASTRTMGARWTLDRTRDGKGWGLALEAAHQSDHAGNPLRFDHAYWRVEPSLALRGVTYRAGWEHLGGDGRHALQTPLATLHAFNGWSDMFLVVPAGGLDDRYLKAGGTLGPVAGDRQVSWSVAYHDFRADTGGRYGQELNASLAVPLSPTTQALVKVADYRSDGFSRDTRKLWLQLEWKR